MCIWQKARKEYFMIKSKREKKFGIKRIFLQVLAFLLVTTTLSACKKDGGIVSDPESDTGGKQKSQAMGRYVESEISLPEGIEFNSIISFQNGLEGKPMLFTKKEDNGTIKYTYYILSEDLTWEEKDCKWLNQPGMTYNNVTISYGEDNKLYVTYSEEPDGDLIARRYVMATEDLENGEQVEISALLETNEMGYVHFPNRVTALKNGNLLFHSLQSIFLYDATGQKKIVEIPSNGGNDFINSNGGNYFIHNNQFYVIDETSRSLILYDGEDGTEKEKYPLELDEYYGVKAVVDENGDLSLMSIAGIQTLKNGSEIWEQMIEGKRNTMGSPKYYAIGFARGSQEDYFVCYGSMDETYKLTHYVYNPDMSIEPETELTIFSLYENSTIEHAVSEFQIENPDVEVDFQSFIQGDDKTIADDVIKTLNTELVAGEGPDILILDGMSEDAYIEKGVLEDITDEIESLISTGDFLANIADGCRVDGRIYSVPVKIGLPMTFGRKAALKEAEQLADLADLVQKSEVGQIFGTIDKEKFLSLYADAFLNHMIDEKGAIQEQNLKEFLTNMKLILDGSKISDGTNENRASSIWALLEEGKFFHSEEIKGFFESEQGISIIEQAKGELEADMISINQSYIPYGTIGINKASKKKELAIQFLQKALSKEVQQSDFYDGFSVNENALEFLSGIERSSGDGYGGPISGVDGKTYEWKITWPSEVMRQKLIEFCKSVKYSARKNWKEKQILLEHTKDYFDGTASLEETVNTLVTKITLYLEE